MKRAAFGSLALAALGAVATPQQAVDTVAPEEFAAVCAWLDRFDDVDLRQLPFVRVATGQRHWLDGESARTGHRHGFLLTTDRRTFRVRFLELDRATLVATASSVAEGERIGFEPVDLRAHAAAFVAHWCDRDANRPPVERGLGGIAPMRLRTSAVLLAHACARCGYEREALALWQLANPQPTAWDDAKPRLAALAADLDTVLVLAIHDAARPWRELLAMHDAWLEGAPPGAKSPVRARRAAIARIVDARALPRRVGEPATDAECIERLRDEVLAPCPARPDDAAGCDLPSERLGPAFAELVRRGLDTVPALLTTLADDSPTRSLATGPAGRLRCRTLGEVAQEVLVAIAGQHTADWAAWFASAQRVGLRPTLLAALADGRRQALRAWVARYPDDVEPLFAALRRLASDVRAPLLATAHRDVPSAVRDRAAALLREDAQREDAQREGPHRLAACERLARCFADASGYRLLVAGCGDGSVPMSTLCSALPDVLAAGVVEVWPLLDAYRGDDDVRAALATALAANSREAVRRHVAAAQREAGERGLRHALLWLLDDATSMVGAVRIVHGRSQHCIASASRADVAAAWLHGCWPAEFPFDAAAPPHVRRLRIEWLRQRRDGVAAPPMVFLPPRPDDPLELLALAATIRTDPAAAARAGKFERFGVAALPHVERLLHDFDAKPHPSFAPLRRVAPRLANELVAVTFSSTATALPPAAQQLVADRLGSSFDAAAMFDLLAALSRLPVVAGNQVVLYFHRPARGGATLHCTIADAMRERELTWTATVGRSQLRIDGNTWIAPGAEAVLDDSNRRRLARAFDAASRHEVDVRMALPGR